MIKNLDREHGELEVQIAAKVELQLRRRLEMFHERVALRQQIAAGLVKDSPLRFDWDLPALINALPGADYVPG